MERWKRGSGPKYFCLASTYLRKRPRLFIEILPETHPDSDAHEYTQPICHYLENKSILVCINGYEKNDSNIMA